ncbi:VOC family protein [Pseudonocardia sp. MH-G8]|uniref:VOC family protein n=1 Tax=Pseudonocardia sp. MH-G8 TaxID=1854588 RepID=UPI0018EA07AC|nr:VOC family protein [Pseudonocardia sp. MH-G8]
MRVTSVMAVVTVADFDAGLTWYERFFGRDPDRRPMDGLAEWRLTDTGVVQLLHDPDRAGRALLTIGVTDLDEEVARLAEREIASGDVVEGVIARIASISDAEGNTITLAQPDEADSDPAIGPRMGEFEEEIDDSRRSSSRPRPDAGTAGAGSA